MDISQLVNGMARGLASPNGKSPQPRVEAEVRSGAKQSTDVRQEQPAGLSQPVDDKTLRDALEKVNKAVQASGNNLEFSVDEETSIRVVKVVDKDSGEVIRQVPSEEVLEIAKSIESMKSMLLSDKV